MIHCCIIGAESYSERHDRCDTFDQGQKGGRAGRSVSFATDDGGEGGPYIGYYQRYEIQWQRKHRSTTIMPTVVKAAVEHIGYQLGVAHGGK